jgi:cytochrome P450
MSSLQLAGIVAVILLVIYKAFVKPLSSPLRYLPAPAQGPARKRLFVEPNADQLVKWANKIPNEGFIKYHGILNVQKVLVTDPNAVHDILTVRPYSFIKPPATSKIIRSLLGNGLVVVEGDAHKTQKKALQPAFKVRNIKDLYPVFERKTEELVSTLSSVIKPEMHPGGSTTVDLGSKLHAATLDVISLASFGKDFACLRDPTSKLVTDYIHGFAPSKDAQKYRMLALILPDFLLDRLPLKRNQELRSAVNAVRDCASGVIEQRCVALSSLEKHSTGASPKDILGTVMTESGMRDKEILTNQSMTILGAGHDTVHLTIEGAIWEMVKNPHVQERLRSELQTYREAIAKHPVDHTIDIPDIDSLPYLQAVCEETLRLHHAVPMIHRRSIEDVPVRGKMFPKGTTFMIPVCAFNLSPKLWKSDPLRFDPGRWLEDRVLGGAMNRNAFMTFSAGARICIGQRFARAEFKHLLAGLVGSYKFTWAGTGEDGQAQELELEHGITSRLIGGLWVKMELLDIV